MEYLIRRGFLQGLDPDTAKNIIDAIVVLPNNLFYGTPIPGAIIFFDKNKPEERKDKVLMVYAAKKGWYREEPNMSVLEPQDMLRISAILASWGDKDKARKWLDDRELTLRSHIKAALYDQIEDIEKEFEEDISKKQDKYDSALQVLKEKEAKNKKPTKSETKTVETSKNALDKVISEKEQRIKDATEKTDKQLKAISDVDNELMMMFADPNLRRRYFAIASIEDIEENEFNLNIPRYVDTFEPEEQIDLKKAIEAFELSTNAEEKALASLGEILNRFKLNA